MERLIAQLKETPRAPGVAEIRYPGEIESLEDARNRKHGLAPAGGHAGRARAGGGCARHRRSLLKRIAEICLRRGYPRARIGLVFARVGASIMKPAPDRLRNNRSPCPPIAPRFRLSCCRPASPCVIRMIALMPRMSWRSTVHCMTRSWRMGPTGFARGWRAPGRSLPTRGSGAFACARAPCFMTARPVTPMPSNAASCAWPAPTRGIRWVHRRSGAAIWLEPR